MTRRVFSPKTRGLSVALVAITSWVPAYSAGAEVCGPSDPPEPSANQSGEQVPLADPEPVKSTDIARAVQMIDVVYLGDAYFEECCVQIARAAAERLKKNATFLLKYLGEHPEMGVVIEGHRHITECPDDPDLSLLRVEAVEEFLVELGLDPQHLEVRNVGNEKPNCIGESEVGCRWRNRRVHFVLQVREE